MNSPKDKCPKCGEQRDRAWFSHWLYDCNTRVFPSGEMISQGERCKLNCELHALRSSVEQLRTRLTIAESDWNFHSRDCEIRMMHGRPCNCGHQRFKESAQTALAETKDL